MDNTKFTESTKEAQHCTKIFNYRIKDDGDKVHKPLVNLPYENTFYRFKFMLLAKLCFKLYSIPVHVMSYNGSNQGLFRYQLV